MVKEDKKPKKRWGDYTSKELEAMSPRNLIRIIQEFQMDDNFIVMSDSYKMTHHLLLPDGLEESYAYLEPRGGEMPYTVMYGLQYYLKKYFCGVRITPEKIEEARDMNIKHFGFDCFDADMWYHIWEKHGGHLPLEIKAVPEGTPVAVKNVLMTIRNLDDKCAGLTNLSETVLLKVWAPNTVAAYARIVRTLITKYHKMSSNAPQWLIDFMHHDFGYRGVSSEETARILASAALSIGFKGTDTLGGVKLARDYYDEEMAGFSVIASEHSVHCSYGGRHKEADGYREIIAKVKKHVMDMKPTSGVIVLSLVSDTYNIYNVCHRILPELADEFIGWTNNHGIPIKIVVRPDSGTPAKILFGIRSGEWNEEDLEIALRCAEDMKISKQEAEELMTLGVFGILFNKFGSSVNEKGFIVGHPQVGVLQGDGVSMKMMNSIYKRMIEEKHDIMNLVFGSGGKYLQAHDRDEQKYATKVIRVRINGKWINVQKKPITDPGKVSKTGELKLVRTGPTWKDFITLQSGDEGFDAAKDELVTVFRMGELVTEIDFATIRKNAEILEEELDFDIDPDHIHRPMLNDQNLQAAA